MSYLARLFWTPGNDMETDMEISRFYLYTHLEKNNITIHQMD